MEKFSPQTEFERYSVGDNTGRFALAEGVVDNLLSLWPAEIPIESVCDVGAGAGTVLKQLHLLGVGRFYTAVDVHHRMPESVRQTMAGVNVQTYVTDTTCMPFATGQFDLGILSHVIEHVADPVPVLKECARICKYLYVEVPLEGTMGMRMTRWLRRKLRPNAQRAKGGHIHFFTPEAMQDLLAVAGLDPMSIRVYYPTALLNNNEAISKERHRVQGAVKGVARRSMKRMLGEDRLANIYNGFAGALIDCRQTLR